MKKLLVGVLFAGLCLGLSMYIQSTAHNAMAVSTQQYTCQPNGTFISPSTGSAALTTEDLETSSRALVWLKNQQLTASHITTSSSITPSQAYASAHTGPVTGTFSLQGVTYPVKSDALLEISSPTSISSTYSGVVQGRVLTPPTQLRWIIQVYKKTESGYVQVPKQALADGTTGEFNIDLSDISNPPAGEWAFGLLDAENSYAPHGA